MAFSILILGFFLCGCSQTTFTPTATLAPTGILTAYRTSTTTPSIPTATVIPVIPVTPAPTATPFLHTITKDDTMLGIAYQYGISLEELQAANPGVDPHFLSVGKQLVVPINGEIPETLPAPTSMPVRLDQPKCYWSGVGGAWCVIAVKNDLDEGIENISAWFGIFDPEGENVASQVAYTPLNLVKSGQTMPIMAYFAPPLPEKFGAVAKILSGLPVANDDPRYIEAIVNDQKTEVSDNGRQASVRGTVILPDDVNIPSQVWILAVAYDASDTIIGVRKWESNGDLSFDLSVYSLAGVIDHLELLIEAKP